MRYVFAGNENFHDEVAMRLANAGFDRCTDVDVAEVVITFCTSQSALEDLYFDEGGFVQAANPGTLLVDFSASTPGFARELGSVATVSDLGFVEAPLVVSDMLDARPFDRENLSSYVAGEEDAIAAAQPVLDAMVESVVPCGAAGTAQLARAVKTLQVAASVVSAIEANALVAAAHRAALGNGLSEVVVSGLTEESESMLAAVRQKRFEGAYTAEMFLSELQAALAAADDADLILPQAEATMHLVELLEVIGGSFKAPSALALVYGEEEECAENGLDWARAEEVYGQHDHGDDDDDDYGYDDEDDCGHDHGFGYSAN